MCFCLSRFVFEANLFSCRCRHFILQHFHTAVEFQFVSRSFGQECRQCRILLARNVSDFVGMPYPVLGTIAKFGNRIAVILAQKKIYGTHNDKTVENAMACCWRNVRRMIKYWNLWTHSLQLAGDARPTFRMFDVDDDAVYRFFLARGVSFFLSFSFCPTLFAEVK